MDQTIGERVKQARLSLGFSAQEMAAALELEGSWRNIYNWESGRSDVPDRYYAQFHHLGIDVTWLLAGLGSMYANNEAGAKMAARSGLHLSNAAVIGRPESGPSKQPQSGVTYLMDLIDAAGRQIQRHDETLEDHEGRIKTLEITVQTELLSARQ